MRLGCRVVLTLALAALLAAPAAAQRQRGQGQGQGRGGFGGFGGGFGGMGSPEALLANESVQKELKLTDEQKKKIQSVNQDVRAKHKDDFVKMQDVPFAERFEKMQEIGKVMASETKKGLEGVLQPEQDKRLKQIYL